MKKDAIKKLKKRNVNLAPLSTETAERISRLTVATGASVKSIIDAATQVLEYSLGKEIILRDMNTHIEEKIDTYTKYSKTEDTQDGQ